MYQAARAAAYRSEALNQSPATQNKKWKAVFVLEDILKARGVF